MQLNNEKISEKRMNIRSKIMERDNENVFSYTYSAKEQDEVKKIREKYEKKEESSLERLRKLDKSVTQNSTIIALAIGIIGSLILGIGMCCCMVWTDVLLIPGIIIGIIGIAIVSANYPMYIASVKRQREKIAPEIMKLTDELMK